MPARPFSTRDRPGSLSGAAHDRASVVVVESCLKDDEVVFDDAIHESVFLIDASRPHVAGAVFEPFRLSATRGRLPQRLVDEEVDAFQHPAIIGLPPLVVIPPGRVEDEPHDRSSS